MAVRVGNQDGMHSAHLIQQGFIRVAALGQLFRVITKAYHRLARPNAVLADKILQPPGQLFKAGTAGQVGMAQGARILNKVAVAVDKGRQQSPAFQVDQPGPGALGPKVAERAHGQDLSVPHGESLRRMGGILHGEDGAAVKKIFCHKALLFLPRQGAGAARCPPLQLYKPAADLYNTYKR